MSKQEPIYNSRNLKVFIQLVNEKYPLINTDEILKYAGMSILEINDPAHWFTQDQIDNFYESLVMKTGNKNLARHAGHYTASSEAMGIIKQYTLGFVSISTVYRMIGKLHSMFSRGAIVRAKKIGPRKMEIISTPNKGVNEKPYQCENRIGIFEAISKLFNDNFARIEHPKCYHKGDDHCSYIITWKKSTSTIWKLFRNYISFFGILSVILFFFLFPLYEWVIYSILAALIILSLILREKHLENKDLVKTIETQGNTAKDLLDEMDIRYNIALLSKEIGHTASTILDMDKVLDLIMEIMSKRLDFDRGMVMLANQDKTLLQYKTGYGYNNHLAEQMKNTSFHLDKPDSKGPFVIAFNNKKPFLVNDIDKEKNNISLRSQKFAEQLEAQSFICVPLIYEKDALGVLAVDNLETKRPLTQSDVSLISGVASQIAISLRNARSFQQLQTSEKKYRDLVENANSIILRMDTKGTITFFNEFAQNFFTYSEEEIIGANVMGSLFKDSDSAKQSFEALINSLKKDPQRQYTNETKILLRTGEYAWVTWTYKPIIDKKDRIAEVLCIGNDITELRLTGEEKKGLETQLLRAQKMEAIGTLAGGVAHDFNNILQAISGCAQILMIRKKEDDPDYSKLTTIEKSVKTARDLTQRLLISSRKVEIELKPIDLNQEIVSISKMLERMIPKMIKIELRLDANLKLINADMTQIEQIIMNLGVNSRDAMPDGGELVFKTENRFLDEEFCKRNIGANPGNYALLTVSDSGHGMDEEVLEHIFEPFFTTKETGKGTGLGMAMVYGIVKSHGGYISVESETGKGTTFMIYFPSIEREFEKEFDDSHSPLPLGGDETLLLVDDDDTIRKVGKEILSNFGYKVVVAEDGESALEFYGKEFQNIDLVLLDLIMPGMGGKKCLERIAKINPEAKVLVVSGFAIDGYTKETVQTLSKGFIKKPYEANQILREVRRVIDNN